MKRGKIFIDYEKIKIALIRTNLEKKFDALII